MSNRFNRRFRLTSSMCSRKASPTLPPIESRFARMPSKPPYWLIHLAAVFGPTPGTPGRLSAVSPTSAARSEYWSGRTKYFASTAAASIGGMSEMPFFGYSTKVLSVISWKASRSPETSRVCQPAASDLVAKVAKISSAS